PACTPNTRTVRADLERDLETTLRHGWALDDYEHEEFIHCVAAPVFDAANKPTAAVSISVHSVILDQYGLLALTPDLLSTTRAISEELGWNHAWSAGTFSPPIPVPVSLPARTLLPTIPGCATPAATGRQASPPACCRSTLRRSTGPGRLTTGRLWPQRRTQ